VGNSNVNENTAISIYPNPVLNELNIVIDGYKEQVGFEIFNSTGQTVFKGNILEKIKVETYNFAPGVYLIRFKNGILFESKRIIKV
ncbi:MAG: T9SS type A sorting domain-containing protein, partial [Bacteroidota bacterium]